MANKVILNLPTRPLHRLMANSMMPSAPYTYQLYTPWIMRATKLYLYYPEAWWVAAGLNNGSLADPDESSWESDGVDVPLIARYGVCAYMRACAFVCVCAHVCVPVCVCLLACLSVCLQVCLALSPVALSLLLARLPRMIS